jgi:ABC-2 type transport system permease protein
MAVDQRTAPLRLHEPPKQGQVRLTAIPAAHNLTAFARNPFAAFFTLVFPLTFFVLIGAVVGDTTDAAGVPITQYLVAPFGAFGVAYAAFTVLASDTALLRENGVLKRWRGTPLPASVVVAGRIASAVVISVLAMVILAGVGIAAYGVEMQWDKLPAMFVTLLVGIACFSALGLALAATLPSATATQAASNGIVILLAFISDIFLIGVELPIWLERVADALPLKHFVVALRGTFDPAVTGAAFAAGHLAVLAVWTLAGAVVAWRMLGSEPRVRSPRREKDIENEAEPASIEPTSDPPAGQIALATEAVGRPSSWALLRGQVSFALTSVRRDAMAVFFAAIFPVLLLLLLPNVYGIDNEVRGMPLPQLLLPAMIAWAMAVSGYANLPEALARSSDRGVHKRLRGTPLPWRWYLTGQIVAATLVSAVATALLFAVGLGVVGADVHASRIPAIAVTFILGAACMSALGVAVFSLVPSAKTISAVTIGTLLPLAFVSDVFMLGAEEFPRVLTFIGDVFPLKHMVNAMLTATRPDQAGAGFAWDHIAVVVAWTAASLVVALIVRSRRP